MFLVLWDLDHTLLEVPNVSHQAYAAGFERATGATFRGLPDMSGRTDRAIITETLRLHRLRLSDETVDRVGEAIGEEYAARSWLVRENGRVLPGATGALGELQGIPGVHQSVLTGNMLPIARVKLSSLGLIDYLNVKVGAFGMDDCERWRLVRVALRRASEGLERSLAPKDIVVIGDTPLDVEAAHRAGTRIIAVATGASTVTDLAAAGAEIVLGDLTNTSQVLLAVKSLFHSE